MKKRKYPYVPRPSPYKEAGLNARATMNQPPQNRKEKDGLPLPSTKEIDRLVRGSRPCAAARCGVWVPADMVSCQYHSFAGWGRRRAYPFQKK